MCIRDSVNTENELSFAQQNSNSAPRKIDQVHSLNDFIATIRPENLSKNAIDENWTFTMATGRQLKFYPIEGDVTNAYLDFNKDKNITGHDGTSLLDLDDKGPEKSLENVWKGQEFRKLTFQVKEL